MFRALQTMVIEVDGRPVELTKGEPVELNEIEGTVLAASGYVERVEDDAQGELYPDDDDGRRRQYNDEQNRRQGPGRG